MYSNESFLYSSFPCSVSTSCHHLWHTKECQSQLLAFLNLSLLFLAVAIALAYQGGKLFLKNAAWADFRAFRCRQDTVASWKAVCHGGKYTYGYLLFIQVCSSATPVHCSTGQGKIAPPLFSTSLHNRLTACLCQRNYNCGDLLFTQVCNGATTMHCTTCQGKLAFLLFSAAL